jgi:hypothetical protein
MVLSFRRVVVLVTVLAASPAGLAACNAILGNEPFREGADATDVAADVTTDAPLLEKADGGDADVDAAPEFDPRAMSGLALWLRADVVERDGDVVTAWKDQSGSVDPGHDFAVPSTWANPSYRAADSEFGQRPSVEFISTDPNAIHGPSLVSGIWAQPLSQPATYYLVFWSDSTHPGGGTILDKHVSVPLTHRMGVGTTSVYFFTEDDGGSQRIESVPGDHRRRSVIAAVVVDGPRSLIAFNTVTPDAGPLDLGVAATGGLTIGAAYGGNANLQGKLAELIVYRFAHGAAERRRVLDYLSARYGIPIQR